MIKVFRGMNTLLKAITFDFWDTLYKAPEDLTISGRRISSFKNALKEVGCELSEDEISKAFQNCWQYAHKYQLEYGMDITPRGHLDFLLDQLQVNLDRKMWEQLYNVYTSVLIDFPPDLNDGVGETLPILASKYKLGVICNTGVTPGLILRKIMNQDGIFNFFEFLVFSDEVRWAKPNVKIFNYALEKLQVENIEAAHVGDDRNTDIEGAKKAGMTAIWLAPQAVDRFSDCDFQVRNIKELTTLLAV